MPQIENISSVLQISSLFEAFCIDMFGVIYDGSAFYPQALQCIRAKGEGSGHHRPLFWGR